MTDLEIMLLSHLERISQLGERIDNLFPDYSLSPEETAESFGEEYLMLRMAILLARKALEDANGYKQGMN